MSLSLSSALSKCLQSKLSSKLPAPNHNQGQKILSSSTFNLWRDYRALHRAVTLNVSDSLRPPGTLVAYQAPPSMGFSGKSAGVDCHFLLQGIFPTQESNPGLPHCGQTLYRLSHQGTLVGLRCVKYSWTRDRTGVPCIGRLILIHCTTREVLC